MIHFSIVIPVYNESEVLASQISLLLSKINEQHFPIHYEIVLVENGSTDTTYRIASRLARTYPCIRVVRLSKASYGAAMKKGVMTAQYPLVYLFNIDFWDIDFICLSQSISDRYDILIGSKNMPQSHDGRPFIRRIMSRGLQRLIQWRFGIPITDTHGLKALWRARFVGILPEIACANHFFDTELLIRSWFAGSRIKELPVEITEIRETRFPFFLRLRQVLKECVLLLSLSLRQEKPSTWEVLRGRPALMNT